jgi:hypothetical protein
MSARSRHRETPSAPAAAGVAGAAAAAKARETEAAKLLDAIGENLLRLVPETSTTLGLDKGDHAELRSQLGDRSLAGQQKFADRIRADLARLGAIDAVGLPHATRTSASVVRSAYATALEGFALPRRRGRRRWRKTPYGSFKTQTPRAPVLTPSIRSRRPRTRGVSRAAGSYPGRSRASRPFRGHASRLVPPAFPSTAPPQIPLSADNARQGGSPVGHRAPHRAKGTPATGKRRAIAAASGRACARSADR